MNAKPSTLDSFWRNPIVQRLWDFFGAASIRVKVMGIVLGVIVLLGVFVSLQLRNALYQTLEDQLHIQGMGISGVVLNRLESNPPTDSAALLEYLVGIEEHYSASGHNTLVDYVILRNPDSSVIAASDEELLIPEIAPGFPSDETVVNGLHQIRKLFTPWGYVIDIITPLGDGRLIQLGLAEDTIEQITNTVALQIFSVTMVMIAVGFVAAFFLTWILTRPILSLVEATRAVAKGDFSHRVTRWANDEIGDLADAFNAMTTSLEVAAQESQEREALRENYVRGVITAQEEERKRIARELHDSTSQSLTSLLVGLRNLESANDLATVRSRIEDIREVVNCTLDEVHALAWQLRPSVLDDLGLVAALGRYIEDFQRRYQVQVDFVTRGLAERLPLMLETSLYRMVQEGLTNIARHAKANNVSILIEQRQKGIRVIIEDNGVGFDPASKAYNQKSLGLQGIRERIQLFGGKLTIESQPGQGSSLFIEIPPTAMTETQAS